MALANITNNVLTDSGTSLSSLATQTYVGTQIANLVASAPSTLDTLNELATALGNDANFATTITTSIGTKQPQLNGTGFVKVTGTTVSYDNSTYLTTGTAGTTYVPYTGSTANVNLGVYNLDGGNININGGGSSGGALRLKQFGSSEANREGYNTISTLTSGVFYFTSSASVPNFKNFVLNPSGLTDNTVRTYALPDASGILALTSNLSSYLPLSGGTLTGPLYINYANPVLRFKGATLDGYIINSSDKLYIADYNTATKGMTVDLSTGALTQLGSGAVTLLGALSGTSASFTGAVTNRGLVIDGANNGNVAKLNWTRTDQSWSINNETNLRFYTSSGNTLSPSTQVLELASSGAATFSSTLTVNGVYYVPNTSYFICGSSGGFRFNNSTDAYNNFIIYENGNTYTRGAATFSSSVTATGFYSTTGSNFATVSGRVGVGTNNPADKFVISNSGAEGIEFGFDTGIPYLFGYNRSTSAYKSIAFVGSGNVIITQGTISDNGSKLQVNGAATFNGNVLPVSDAIYTLGSASFRWNHVYTTDLHLSNEGKQNIVDGTWGDWTLQEGENDIFMLNNRSGDKFKIKLEKI